MIHVASDKLKLINKLRASGDSQQFPAIPITYSLMDQYKHSLSIDATIMVSH